MFDKNDMRMQKESILDFLADRLTKNQNDDEAKTEYMNASIDYTAKYSTVAEDAE